jgi:hypothetical protein
MDQETSWSDSNWGWICIWTIENLMILFWNHRENEFA